MNFPTTSLLAENPRLVEWLTARGWEEEMESHRPMPRYPVVVDSIHFGISEDDAEIDEDETVFDVQCHDGNGRGHRTRLAIFEDYQHATRRTVLDCISECSCDEIFGCRHMTAALEKLREIATNAVPVRASLAEARLQMKEWLHQLEWAVRPQPSPPTEPAKPYNKFLVYCIEEVGYGYHRGGEKFKLVPRVANRGKKDVAIEKGIAHPDLFKPQKYVAPEDIPICLKLQQKRSVSQEWGDATTLTGEGWDEMLDAIFATGRVFLERLDPERTYRSKKEYLPLEVGPEIFVEAEWEKLEDGFSRPVLKLPHSEVELIPIHPMRYLDRKSGRLGLVKSHLPEKVLLAWKDGPRVPNEVLNEMGQGLVKLSQVVQLPVPEEKPAAFIRDLAPEPVLLIAEVRVGIYQKRHIGAILQFQYGAMTFYPLMDGAPPQATWYDGDVRFVLERDAAAEAKFAKDLIDHGFTPLHLLYAPSDLTEKNRHSVVLGDLSMELRSWLEFLDSPIAHALREQGWTIHTDTKLNLTIHDIGDFFPEIEEDAQYGIDWFRFDVTGEFDGKRISLIPHIARAIRDDWTTLYADPETRPSSMLLPCDNPSQGHIRFPAERFLTMVDQVRHLFLGIGKADGPLRMDRIHAAGVADSLGVDSSETTRALAVLGQNLRDIQGIPAVEVPATIQADLRPYQIDGFRWLQFLARHGLHGVLADDMGLGKTLQTLAHLAAEVPRAQGRPSLVIAPTSVVPNWAAEAKKFAPKLKTLVLHGSERGDSFEDISKADVVFTTYPLLARDFEILRTQDWHVLVLDEAQYIKNPKALSSQCACKLRAAHRVCLSGTPMENHLGELWSLMRFLMPGFLSDEKTFNSFIRKPIEREHSRDAQLALNRRVSPLILRRTKDQVATELPEKTTLIHNIDLSGKQTDLYESVRAAMDERVREAISEKGLAKSHIIVLDALLKLRQICCHPQLLKSEAAQRVTESAKLEYLVGELLPTLLEEGRRILLFSQFTSMLELIEEHLNLEKITYLKLTGQTKERAKLVKQFQTGETPVFLISLKAGGTGLNLTAADTVIHYDPWWNPAAENQATDRAHRIGQMKPVFVHKLVCTGTIEERILELQKHKSALVEALLSEETTKLKIDSDTLSHLFSPIG